MGFQWPIPKILPQSYSKYVVKALERLLSLTLTLKYCIINLCYSKLSVYILGIWIDNRKMHAVSLSFDVTCSKLHIITAKKAFSHSEFVLYIQNVLGLNLISNIHKLCNADFMWTLSFSNRFSSQNNIRLLHNTSSVLSWVIK